MKRLRPTFARTRRCAPSQQASTWRPWAKAHYLASELEKIGCKLKYTGEFFHEFVTETACPNCRKKILDALAGKNILGGAEVDGGILWCVTELVSKEKLDEVVAIVKEVLGK